MKGVNPRQVRCVISSLHLYPTADCHQLIDFIITTHPAYPELLERSKNEQKDIHISK